MLGRKRPVEAHRHHADVAAGGVAVVHRLPHRAADRSHGDDDALGLGRAVVVEKVVVAAGEAVDVVHIGLNDAGQGGEEGVGGFPLLEENVRVLGGAAGDGMLGVERPGPERRHRVPIHRRPQRLVVEGVYLLDFVAGAEAVEEMQEGQPAPDGGEVGHGAHIHRFLRTARGQQGKAGLAAGHDVRVIAEDGKGVDRHGAGRDMEDAGQQFSGYLVHVGYHQEQALAGRVGCGEGARPERAVDGACRAAFRLHFRQAHGLAEHVLAPGGAPFVHQFRHRRRRRDRKDARDFGKEIRYVRRGRVAVHGRRKRGAHSPSLFAPKRLFDTFRKSASRLAMAFCAASPG
ncbi:MAG: hypothetical protein LUE17_16270 [Planctomycetaceae bacterium]|nr:hypothetical protein [Planctomycetaceae bacterium]